MSKGSDFVEGTLLNPKNVVNKGRPKRLHLQL